jgi:uncharacterized membrane protein YesL
MFPFYYRGKEIGDKKEAKRLTRRNRVLVGIVQIPRFLLILRLSCHSYLSLYFVLSFQLLRFYLSFNSNSINLLKTPIAYEFQELYTMGIKGNK